MDPYCAISGVCLGHRKLYVTERQHQEMGQAKRTQPANPGTLDCLPCWLNEALRRPGQRQFFYEHSERSWFCEALHPEVM